MVEDGRSTVQASRMGSVKTVGTASAELPRADVHRASPQPPQSSSRPKEFHLRALPEPCVTLSSHTAPDVRPLP